MGSNPRGSYRRGGQPRHRVIARRAIAAAVTPTLTHTALGIIPALTTQKKAVLLIGNLGRREAIVCAAVLIGLLPPLLSKPLRLLHAQCSALIERLILNLPEGAWDPPYKKSLFHAIENAVRLGLGVTILGRIAQRTGFSQSLWFWITGESIHPMRASPPSLARIHPSVHSRALLTDTHTHGAAPPPPTPNPLIIAGNRRGCFIDKLNVVEVSWTLSVTTLILSVMNTLFEAMMAANETKRGKSETLRINSLLGRTRQMASLAVCAIAFLFCLDAVGIPISSVWGSLGVLTLAFGLASQQLAINFLSGLNMMFFKPFQVGDLIQTKDGECMPQDPPSPPSPPFLHFLPFFSFFPFFLFFPFPPFTSFSVPLLLHLHPSLSPPPQHTHTH